MATILRTSKFMNFFTGYYLKKNKFCYSSSIHNLERQDGESQQKTIEEVKFTHMRHSQDPQRTLTKIKNGYYRSKFVHHADINSLLKLLDDKNTEMDSTVLSTLLIENDSPFLIRCCGQAMLNEMPNVRSQLTNSLWQLLKTRGVKLTTSHYNALLNVHLENEQDFSPAEILLEMSNNDVEPDDHTYEYLITQYCRKGDIAEANKILSYLKENEIPINENVFNAFIIGNAEANDMNGALSVLDTMDEMGCYISSKTYSTLMEAFAKKGDIESIMQTLQKCGNKNVIISDMQKMNIMYQLAINGHTEHISQILSIVYWDKSSYIEINNFISKLIYHKQMDAVVDIFQAARKSGLSEIKLNSNAIAVKNLVAINLPENVVIDTFNKLENERINAYETSLLNCFNVERVHYCIPLLRAWKKNGVEIKEPLFWPLLSTYGENKFESVLETLRLMRNEFKINPSLHTLSYFVLSYNKTKTSDEMMEILTNDLQIPVEPVINAILHNKLFNNNIESAAEFIKTYANSSINYDKRELIPVLKKALQVTENNEAYKHIKERLYYRFDLKHKSNRETNLVLTSPLLQITDLGFRLKKYSDEENLIEANNCFMKLKQFTACMLPVDKFLSYYKLLVKNSKMEDATQLLEHLSSNMVCSLSFSPKVLDQCKSTLNALADEGSVEAVNQLFQFLVKKKSLDPSIVFLKPLVKVHLVRNEWKEALNVAKRIHDEYNIFPMKLELLSALIQAEAVKELQWLSDFCIQHEGQSVSLLRLSIAFIKCERTREAMKVLASVNECVKNYKLKVLINSLLQENDTSTVKSLLNITKGLDVLNRTLLYDMLLEKCSILNDWKEGIELWKQMQEEKVIASDIFLLILNDLLRKNDQSLPCPLPDFLSKTQNEELGFYKKLVRTYFGYNIYPNESFLKVIIGNLVEDGDTKTITQIYENWNYKYSRLFLHSTHLLDAYMKSNNLDSYLQHINESLSTKNKTNIKIFDGSITPKFVGYLITHAKSINLLESVAFEMMKLGFVKPILAVISYYFLKDDPKGEELCNEFLGNNKQLSSYSMEFLVQAYVQNNYFDRLSQLIKKVQNLSPLERRKFYYAFIDAYGELDKHEDGFRVLISSISQEKRRREKYVDDSRNNNLELTKSEMAL